MATVIAVIIGASLSLLVLLRDTLPKRDLRGTTSREYFSHPFDYELGWRLVFTKLPGIQYAGSLITFVLFFALVTFILPMIASLIDGTLTDPQSRYMFTAFIEDPLMVGQPLLYGVMFYLYRRVFEHVPDAMLSIARSRNTQDGNYTISPKAEDQLKSTASFIFQAGDGRKTPWLLFDVLGGIALICMVAFSELNDLRADPLGSVWADPGNPFGNAANILLLFFVFYFARPLVSYLLRLAVAMWSIGKAFERENLLHVEPLHPDGAGGLAEFGNLGWRMASLILPIALYLVFWWFARIPAGRGAGVFFVPGIIALVVMVPVVFFLPLWGLHTAMAKARKRALDVLSRRFYDNAPAMRKCLEGEGSVTRDEGLGARENIENISALYEHVSKMPVWPFNTATVVRLGGYMLVVLMPILVQRFSGL